MPWAREYRGTPGAIRTRDTRFRKPLLYPSELQGRDRILKLINVFFNVLLLYHNQVCQCTLQDDKC